MSAEVGLTAAADTKKIDLRTTEGAQAVKAQWRYADAKIVPIHFKARDGQMKDSYDIQPHAEKPDFDDHEWETVDPTTLGRSRGPGKFCVGWYRVQVTLPEGVVGKTVSFVTTVDDYGEVWVDGKLPYKEGHSGGAIVAGFNCPNRVVLADPQPGKTYSIAIFAINGPISVVPINCLFLREAYLEISEP